MDFVSIIDDNKGAYCAYKNIKFSYYCDCRTLLSITQPNFANLTLRKKKIFDLVTGAFIAVGSLQWTSVSRDRKRSIGRYTRVHGIVQKYVI